MGLFKRRAGARFADLMDRQLNLFLADNRDLLERIEAAERAYDAAGRDTADPNEATQLWGDVVDLVEEGTETLADTRDHYAWNQLGGGSNEAEKYVAAFNRAVAKRLPRFGLEIENR